MPFDNDIDSKLAEDFGIEEVEETINTENDAEINQEDEINDEESTDEVEETEKEETDSDEEEVESEVEDKTETTETEKPSQEEKKDYTFAQFRTENSKLKQEIQQLEQLAKSRGYDNYNDFINDLNVASDTLDAQKKNIEPTVYRELMTAKRENQELQRELNTQKFERSVENLKTVLDATTKELNLGTSEEGTNFIVERLEENGFTVEELLASADSNNTKKITSLVKSVLLDKYQEKAITKQQDKVEKLSNIADNKYVGTPKDESFNVNDIIAQEMKKYKADNYL